MLIEKKMVNKESCIEKFDRKFSNFCEKNILSLYYTIYPEYIEIIDNSGLMEEPLEYEFNFNKSARTMIHDIIEDLKEFYPKMYHRDEKVYTTSDFKELLRKYTPDEIEALEVETDRKLMYTVYRVNNEHNEINIIDHSDFNRKKTYKFTIPVMEFINVLYKDSDEAYKLFKSKAKYISLI
jgi:hypothetical protein